MSLTSRTRFVNPRLGTYFGIFASSLVGLVLLLLMRSYWQIKKTEK